MTTPNFGLPRKRAIHGIKAVLLLAAACSSVAAQNSPQISWYTLGGSDFNPMTGQTQTLGVQVFLHSSDSRVLAFRATAAVQVGSGLGSPAVQANATNILDGTDAMVYIPVTAYKSDAALTALWVVIELFLKNGSTYSSVQRMPAPWQNYAISIDNPATNQIYQNRVNGMRR